jgi:short-subunit dehydrogenase
VLVARRRQTLGALGEVLIGAGVSAHVISADLSDTERVPTLA